MHRFLLGKQSPMFEVIGKSARKARRSGCFLLVQFFVGGPLPVPSSPKTGGRGGWKKRLSINDCTRFLCLLLGCLYWSAVSHAQETPDSRGVVPSAERQQSKRAQVDEAVGLSKAITVPQKKNPLRELMKMASDVATSSDELYVVLQAAFSLIRETGDIAALRVAMQKLTETFQVDPITELSRQLEQFIAACKSTSALDPAVKDFVPLVEKAGRANRFQDARRGLDSTENAAKKLNAKSSVALLGKSRSALVEREQAF